ncbi:hypothetical protein ACFLSI_04325 [Bacteroidota bacterium]
MEILIYIGSAIIFFWGVAHIIPSSNVVKGFDPISGDNRKIILMEWIAEGMTLSFIGILAFIVTLKGGLTNPTSELVIYLCAVMLVIMAILSAFTGARTKIIPMKICPYIKTLVAILYILGMNI